MKRQTVASAKKKVWVAFSLYIRTRDCLKTTGCTSWGLCITCGKRNHIKLLQAGHFVAGRHNANLFSEEGVNAQCYNCNINLKGNTLEYRRMVVELYGKGTDVELEKEARQIKKYTILDLEELMVYYKEKTREMEE